MKLLHPDNYRDGKNIRVKLQTSPSAYLKFRSAKRRLNQVREMIFGINSDMKILIYINYFIYKYYEQKDPDPIIYSFFGSSLLVSLNIISGLIVSQELAGLQFSRYYSIIVLIVLLGVNYFYLYKKSKHKDIFFAISQDGNIKRKYVFFLIYLFLTIILILSLVSFIRIKKFKTL